MAQRLYLYAVVDGLPALPRTRGVSKGALRECRVGALTVIAAPVEQTPKPEVPLLRAHDRVIRKLWTDARAVVPFRFATVVDSEEKLAKVIRPLAPKLRAALRQVAGREQMALRLFAEPGYRPVTEAAPTDRSSGAAYLRQRLENERRQREVPELAEACAQLKPLVRGEKAQRSQREGPLVASVFHLVDRGQARAYSQRVRSDVSLPPGLRLMVAGPSPAYAFAPSPESAS